MEIEDIEWEARRSGATTTHADMSRSDIIEYPNDEVSLSMSGANQQVRGLRIALGCQSRVGKDTFADHAVDLHGGVKLAFASRLYAITNNIQQTLGMVVQKDPTLLQRQGTELRAYYGDDLFASKIHDDITALVARDPNTNIFVTDLRCPVEFDMLQKLGFTMIRVIKPGRVIDRDANHSTEVGLANHEFDYVITNDGDMDFYMSQVDATIKSIMSRSESYVPTAGSGHMRTRTAGPCG